MPSAEFFETMTEKELKQLIENDYQARLKVCLAQGAELPNKELCAKEIRQMLKQGIELDSPLTEQQKWEAALRWDYAQYKSPKVGNL
jgi:hypothetical protein